MHESLGPRRTISAANRNFGSMAIQSAEREEEEEEMCFGAWILGGGGGKIFLVF